MAVGIWDILNPNSNTSTVDDYFEEPRKARRRWFSGNRLNHQDKETGSEEFRPEALEYAVPDGDYYGHRRIVTGRDQKKSSIRSKYDRKRNGSPNTGTANSSKGKQEKGAGNDNRDEVLER